MRIKFSKTLLSIWFVSLGGCTTDQGEIINPVTWYAVNGWTDTVTFELYDQVCERFLRDIRLNPGRQLELTTCGDEQGNGSVRYRRDRIAAAGSPWTRENTIRPQQTVYMR